MQQANTWANVDLDLCHRMALMGHNELNEGTWWWIQVTPDVKERLMIGKIYCWKYMLNECFLNTILSSTVLTLDTCINLQYEDRGLSVDEVLLRWGR